MTVDLSLPNLRQPSRSEAAHQGQEAVAIAASGFYTAPSGRRVDIADAVARSVAGTREYRPEVVVAPPASARGARDVRTSVVKGTSLASGRAFAARGLEPLILNFASAKSPGGGFLGGARAQEESIARASGLYACLSGRAMYDFHRARQDAMYTSWMIHSPGVPVFRDDDGALLEEPWSCAILTAPAPNATAVLERAPERRPEIERELRARVGRVLAIAAGHGHRHLVLGAWGCGVFGNDSSVVAAAFRDELRGPHEGLFDEVVFAVLDMAPSLGTIRAFAEMFPA